MSTDSEKKTSSGGTATAPTSITLAVGKATPVVSVTNVAIPAAGATDSTGSVTGWHADDSSTITFTVTDGGSATSAITINGSEYTSGADYTITSTSDLTIIVTTTESGKTTAVRTFTVSVAGYATAPSSITLAVGDSNPVGSVTNVAIPNPGATDTTGAITDWTNEDNYIKFTVTDAGDAESTITIKDAAYTSGDDYDVTSDSDLTIVDTTTESGTTTAVRTFTVSVTEAAAEYTIEQTIGTAAHAGVHMGQTFTVPADSTLVSIQVTFAMRFPYTGTGQMLIYDSEDTKIGTSTNTIQDTTDGEFSSIEGSFTFNDVSLTNGETYSFEVYNTVQTNSLYLWEISGDRYANGNSYTRSSLGGSKTNYSGHDAEFIITYSY